MDVSKLMVNVGPFHHKINEREIMDRLLGTCAGKKNTVEDHRMVYNIIMAKNNKGCETHGKFACLLRIIKMDLSKMLE